MTNWKFTIDVTSIWQKARNREIEVNDFKTKLYDILSIYTHKVNSLSLDAIEVFNNLLSELNDSEFEDYDDFDYWMSNFYDFCDDYKIWFKTF